LILTFSKARYFLLVIPLSFAGAVSLCGLAVRTCEAQQSSTVSQIPLQATTEIVKVDASVIDKHGEFVGSLTRNNFRILDNGVEQPIVFFAPVEAPAQVLVMIETSPAVYLIHNEHLAAAYALLDGLAPDDQVALVTYDRAPQPILGFTADKSVLLSALDGVQYTIGMGDLSFYDSVSTVLDWIRPVTGKRAMVVLTTGLDSSSSTRWEALAAKLRGENIVIYCVSLAGKLRPEPGKKPKAKKPSPKSAPDSASDSVSNPVSTSDVEASFARADTALLSLATITGGRAYFPKSDKEFVSIYRQIASALRHEYVLGIAPAHDAQFHSITVNVVESGIPPANPAAKQSEYRVFTRAGYIAPAP
jgi:Ca-activated chloride channel homolog